jgi:chorismate mutase / prephenate dehydratase
MALDPELAQWRAAIDDVNTRLVAVLHERAHLCRAIGAWKRARGMAGPDAEREAEMLAAMLRDPPAHGFTRAQLEPILRAVLAASRELVERADG